jgi:uncharacterized protein YukE
VASDGFEVLTGALLEASPKYRAASASLAQCLAQFKSASALDDSVWGRVPGAAIMSSQYEEFRSQVIKDLTSMYKALVTGAVNLASSAASYRAADAAIAELAQGLLEAGFSEQQIASAERLDAEQHRQK